MLFYVNSRDPENEGAVEYRTTSGNGTVLFTLNQQKGVITVASNLDGHRGRIYTVNVQAHDAGKTFCVFVQWTPSNSKYAEVFVAIKWETQLGGQFNMGW